MTMIVCASGEEEASAPEPMPHVRVDREAGVIDLDAVVVQREPDWLELLACSPGTREHESLVTIAAEPRQVHLALILLGLEPGSPSTAKRVGDEWIVKPPTGPRVEIFFVLENDGRETEIPANQWVRNQETGEALEGNAWLFTGSRFIDWQGKRWYLADENGTVISLVNFGDDLLARKTSVTDQTDNQAWTAFTQRVPEIGAELIVRLRPVVAGPEHPAPPSQRDD